MKNIKSILAVTVLSILLFSCNSDDSENIGQISNDPIEEITVENATHYKITWDTLNDKIRINELNDIPVENPVWIVNECMETLGGNGFVNFRFFADINDYFEVSVCDHGNFGRTINSVEYIGYPGTDATEWSYYGMATYSTEYLDLYNSGVLIEIELILEPLE